MCHTNVRLSQPDEHFGCEADELLMHALLRFTGRGLPAGKVQEPLMTGLAHNC